MRFLHTADLHLDSPLRAQGLRNAELGEQLHLASRQVLSRIVDLAVSHKVDAVILAGDVFDSEHVDVTSRAALSAEMGRLTRAGIPAAMIQGNHDALMDLDRFGPIADNVIVLNRERPTYRLGDASLHGIGFSGRHMPESLLPDYPAPEAGRLNLGVMHTSLGGAPGHDPYAPCAEADLLSHGYLYWALGHIHQRFERRGQGALAVMPGIPQGRSIREAGLGSVTLVELDHDGARATRLPVGLVSFEWVDADLSSAGTQAHQIELMADALRAAKADLPDVMLAARLRLHHADTLIADPEMARELAHEAAPLAGDTFVEAVRFARAASSVASGVIADLAAMMVEDAATAGFQDEARAALADLRTALPREIQDVLSDEMLTELVDQGIASVAAHLATGSDPE